jgi:hypothetical protein
MSVELHDFIDSSGMSDCCSGAVYDPSAEGIEGRCMDCGEMCSIVNEA